ncbi:RloB family protein [Chitinophaga pinensis]|uniref:RloB family protein n=1 Tax=Chitinophaga pinensis TaxID=79329 RepID=UPI001C99526B|nr:RloB family protein [Chitinophaga pinensis]
MDDAPVIPKEYVAQPTRYVWEAQQGLKDGTYDEAWAVFDKDQHPEHAEAFDLAGQSVNGNLVQIAFSSVSFETWILLHHEFCTTAFRKSQCRTQKESHECGQGVHEQDCNGIHCITGYLKIKGYIGKDVDVKHIGYASLQSLTHTALGNALQLRHQAVSNSGGNLVHLLNPYTCVDRLVFKLLQLKWDYKWRQHSDAVIHGLSLHIERQGNVLRLTINNHKKQTFILLPAYIHLSITGGPNSNCSKDKT